MLAADVMNEYIDKQGVKKSSTMRHIVLIGATVANAEAWASMYALQECASLSVASCPAMGVSNC
jgi:hypothetical protein